VARSRFYRRKSAFHRRQGYSRRTRDGYVKALRKAYELVPDSADFVMYWWQRAAELARAGKIRRFGFITTNSLPQVFNRKVVAQNLSADSEAKLAPLSLIFAIPDHPWLKSALSDGQVATDHALCVSR